MLSYFGETRKECATVVPGTGGRPAQDIGRTMAGLKTHRYDVLQ
jgi:hypothetical protein